MQLLSPIKLGPVEVKNRVVSTAHAAFLDFWKPGDDGERYMAYQERRAEGGCGLIILTAAHVHATSQIPGHWVYQEDDIAPKFQQMSSRVHRHGGKVISQLFHFGVQGKSESRDDMAPLWGFSGLPSGEGEASHEMTDEEIEEVIEAFADAARVATYNGIDGVELHGTHGYLIQQSFSPYANHRKDKWGEPLYFTRRLAQRVREAIGPNKVLGFRISADDFLRPQDGGLGPERLAGIASAVIGTGLFDYLNHSEGKGGFDYARAIGSYRHAMGEFLPLTRGLREAVGGKVPVIGVGKIATVDIAERAIESGDCDMVGMTRAQIADPDIVHKLEHKQGHRIRPCTGANQACIDRAGNLLNIMCIHNPEVGEENRFKALAKRPPAKSKKVLVVGGGPAGMKAAEIAARHGHDVTLVEAGSRLGGRFNLVEKIGPSNNLMSTIAWVEQELALLKVKILLQTSVDEAFVRAFGPDEIIMATGAVANNDLGVPNDGSMQVLTSDEAAVGTFEGVRLDMKGTRSLLVDPRGNYENALVIESLAKQGSRVTVATPFLYYGSNMGFTHLADYLKLLPKWNVEIRAQTVLTSVADGKARLLHVFSQQEAVEEFDFIVSGRHPKSRGELFNTLRALAPTRQIGDVLAPRSAHEAFREGDRAGRTL